MKWSSVLAVILVICWLDNPAHGSGEFLKPFKEFGVVTSTNGTFKFVGQLLELYCNITNLTIQENSSRLHFEKGDKTVIDSRYIEILTTKTIRLRLYNVSLEEEDHYVCVLTTFFNKTLVIGYQEVLVDYKPEPVSDISCRVYNWEEMNCTWDLGVQFRHLEYINTTLVWTVELPSNSRSFGSQHVCPDMGLNFCFWNKEHYHHGNMYFMTCDVHTIVQDKVIWAAESRHFKIETINYVEPAPVIHLGARTVNSSCVGLSWDHTAEFRENKAFLAESRKSGEQNWASVYIDQKQKNIATVCHLPPYTSYEFRMAVLPYPEDSKKRGQGYRSQWRTVTAKTAEDIPSAAPEICPGCYYELSQPSDNRLVRLYWKDLPDDVKNGQLTKYRFIYLDQNIDRNITSGPMTSTLLDLVSSDVNTLISITPATIVGFADSSASLLLPMLQKKPNAPSNFLVETDGKARFYLSWEKLTVDEKSGLEYSSVTIVWCVGMQETVCRGDIHWIQLPADSVTYDIPVDINNTNVLNDYLVGITAEVQNHGQTWSSGIHWNKCTYFHNRRPQSDPKNLRESSEHPARGLLILWEKFHCSEERSFIIEYLIEYCPLNENNECTEPEQSYSVSNTAREVNLQDLRVGARYQVNVTAVSSAGLGPPGHIRSAEVKEWPSGSDFPSDMFAVVIVVPVLIIGTILFSLWCICQCRLSKKKVPKTSMPHRNIKKTEHLNLMNRPLPARPGDPINDFSTLVKQYSKDSHSSGSRAEESDTSESLLVSNDDMKRTTRSNNASTIICETRPLLNSGEAQKNPQMEGTRIQIRNHPASENDTAPSYVLYDTDSTSGAQNNPQVESTRSQIRSHPASENDTVPSYVLYDIDSISGVQVSNQKSKLEEESSAKIHRYKSSECRLKSNVAPEYCKLQSVGSQLLECVGEPGCSDMNGGLVSSSSPQTSSCASYSRLQEINSNPVYPLRAEGPSGQNYQPSLNLNSRLTTSGGSCADYSTLNLAEDESGREDLPEAGVANFSDAGTLHLRPHLEYIPVYQVSREPSLVHCLTMIPKNEASTLKEDQFDPPPQLVNVSASPLFFMHPNLMNFQSAYGSVVKSGANKPEYVPHSQLHHLFPFLSKDDNQTDDQIRVNITQAEVPKFIGPECNTADLTNTLLDSSITSHHVLNTRASQFRGTDYISWDAASQLASRNV